MHNTKNIRKIYLFVLKMVLKKTELSKKLANCRRNKEKWNLSP